MKKHRNTVRAGVYVRISKDTTGRAAGVRRQEQDCRELAAAKGWEVAEVYQDNDVSAYRRKPRPGWRRLLEAAKAGDVQAIVAWHPDRMYRRAADLEDLVTFVESHKLRIATCQAGDVDLATASGRMTARIVGAVAQGESERMGERIRSGLRERREAGLPSVGGIRPYGYQKVGDPKIGEPVRLVVHPEEAEVLRDAARSIVAGSALGRVAKDLNLRGVPTAGGGRWSPYLLKETLLKPQAAGLQPDGTPGNWEAILDPRERRMLERRLDQNGKGRHVERPGARRYMLTGVATCAACGKKMMGAGDYYRCTILRGGCGKTAVQAPVLEAEVFAKVDPLNEKRWRSRRPQRRPETEQTLTEMEKLEARLDELAGDLGLSERALAVRERAIQEKLARLRDRLPQGNEEPPSPDLERTQELLQAWSNGSLDPRGLNLLAGFVASRVKEVRVEPGRGNVPRRTQVRLAR